MHLTDSVTLQGVRRTRDGYLVATARIARTGIYTYGGGELGRPDLDTVRVYRPEDEVFEHTAMSNFAHRPITNNHPQEPVTSENWKDTAVGQIGGEIARDGSFLSVPLAIMDGATIADYEAGKRELSAGYSCELEWTAGTSPDGEAYDAIQRKIRANHLAVVDRGRAGPECRIGDAANRQPPAGSTPPTPTTTGERPVADATLRTVVLDGLTISTTDQGAEAIGLLQRRLADAAAATEGANTRVRDAEAAGRVALDAANGQIAALRAEVTRVTEAKDGEIAALRTGNQAALDAKDGEIATLRAQSGDAALDARVVARAALLAQVRPFLGDAFNPAGLSDAAIRREVVVKALGASLTNPEAKGDAYFDAAFDTVMSMAPRGHAPAAPADPLRAAIASAGFAAPVQDAAKPTAWQANVQRLSDAWKSPTTREVV